MDFSIGNSLKLAERYFRSLILFFFNSKTDGYVPFAQENQEKIIENRNFDQK